MGQICTTSMLDWLKSSPPDKRVTVISCDPPLYVQYVQSVLTFVTDPFWTVTVDITLDPLRTVSMGS
jgi:hypothetical protein